MNTILLIHGPNLNRLGSRDPQQYGTMTLNELEIFVQSHAKRLAYDVRTFQSNHEGELIDWIQENTRDAVGIVINPGALSHYSYALHDALLDTQLPCVEVHLSNIHAREPWRAISVTAPACIGQIVGKREKGYIEALEMINQHRKRSV